MFKSIYRKIVEDFNFIIDYGFLFDHESKHYIHPSVVFKKDTLRIQIGFNYEDHKCFINLSDSRIKKYTCEETLDRIAVLDPGRLDLFSNGIPECNNLLDGVMLIGTSYKAQLEQVKSILRTYLEKMTQKT